MFSEYFIKRKIIAIALFLIISLFGFVSLKSMPVAQYPKLSPPTISITASYPGADAKTIETSIIEPIESQLSGVRDLMYISSKASNSGVAKIECTFNIGTDIDKSYIDIQNKVSTIEATLPAVVRTLGINVQKKSTDILLIIAVSSPDNSKDQIELSNFTSNFIMKKVRNINGAGEAEIFGKKDYSMRVWVDPVKLNNYGLTSKDVSMAISEQNNQVSIGKIGQEPAPKGQELTLMVKSKGRLQTVKEFEEIIIKTSNTGNIKIKDVAMVELGTSSYEFNSVFNGKKAVLLAIFADPESNALDTADEVKTLMKKLERSFPQGVEYTIPYDTTDFVKLSIKEVVKTFLEAMVLVSLVIYFFLHSFRASLIPIIAIPVSILGTFIIMHLLGYSINTLTLFGLVLSIGIIVDDAIVVVENVERIIKEESLNIYESSIKAMKQITSPIIAIVFVISAVFIPTIFMGGITGELYKQFAITVAIAVSLSGIVALTLSPVLCTMIINDEKHDKEYKFDIYFNKMTEKYVNTSMKLINNKFKSLFLYLFFFVFIIFIGSKIPTSFFPQEDQGVFMTIISLPEGASVQRTNKTVEDISKIYRQEKSIKNIVAMIGSDSPNTAMIYSRLTPYEERTEKAADLIKKLTEKTKVIKEAQIMIMQPPAIRGLGKGNAMQFRVLNYGEPDSSKLSNVSNDFASKLGEDKDTFMFVKNTTKNNSPVLFFELDREKAKILNVNINDVYEVLRSTISYANVNQFEKDGHLYWVQVQAKGEYRNTPEDLLNVYIKNNKDDLIQLSTIGRMVDSNSPSNVEHFNSVESNAIMGMIMPGKGSHETMMKVEKLAEELPKGFSIEWEGMSLQEKISQGKNVMIFSFAIIMVFLVLSIQYNSFVLPLAVISSVIFGMFGAFVAQLITTVMLMQPKDIYFSIGLLTLIGLSAKNAILIIEFAEELRHKGMNIYDATKKASEIRYRPMMMTSFAFIFGILPLVFSHGAGAESRFSIGVGLLGGMIAATFIERYFIPYLYYYIATFDEKLKLKMKKKGN
jgi:hydrophobe/amphiphile efflux-1 (HAE1) family protein